ncbi:MAG: amidase, partial [Acidimicrobiia bacterium]
MTVSVVNKVTAALERAHTLQDTLNTFIFLDDDAALERAARLDGRIAAGEELGPLAGMPIAVKDLIDQAGRITTNGSAFYREMANETAPCIAGIENADGIVIGRTGLHEWAFGFSSENPHFGPVRNPWDTATSPGGSSGGSAVAVAAGITPIAVGTDTGGSVRVPAGLCGTFGLKVTHGRISLDGVFPLAATLDTVGPLANSMENIGLAYRAMSGDSTSGATSRSLRFGVPEPWCREAPIELEIKEAFEIVIQELETMGHQVHPIDLPDVKPSPHIWNALAEEARNVHRPFRQRGETYGEDLVERLDDADLVTDEEISKAREWQTTIRQRFSDAFATVDYLITPTVAARRKVIGDDYINS